MTPTRRLHRIVGLVLMLPLCGWAITGVVFFVKPGYAEAYSGLSVKTSHEVRELRTVLGDHRITRDESGWAHDRDMPDDASLRRLIDDAIADKRERYGEIANLTRDGTTVEVETTTGVTITLDWSTLSLRQSGPDTRRIDMLYRIHYLQWTGVEAVDRVLGIAGLAALVLLTALGVKLAFGRSG